MQTIYLILSSDCISIKENINKILKENGLDNNNLIKYDLSNTLIDTVIEDLDTYNFLVDRKVIVCENASFLLSSKTNSLDHNIDNFIKYLNNPSPNNILILITDKLDIQTNIKKNLKEKVIVIENDISIDRIIKDKLEDFKMDDKTIKYFIDYCGNNNEKILNELEKLKCYKFEDKLITINDINLVVLKSFNDNVFSLVDAIMNKKRNIAISLYENLLNNGEDMNKILSLLADQFRMIYNGRILLKDHNGNYDEVASLLGVHPYRFKKAIESSYNYSISSILDNLNKIDEIEIKKKTGKNTVAMFEIFIYSL